MVKIRTVKTPVDSSNQSQLALYNTLTTSQQLQLYVKETVYRVIFNEEDENGSEDEISTLLQSAPVSKYSSPEQQLVFQQICVSFASDLQIKTKLEPKIKHDNEEDESVHQEQVDALFKRVYERLQPDDPESTAQLYSKQFSSQDAKQQKQAMKRKREMMQQSLSLVSDDTLQQCTNFLEQEATLCGAAASVSSIRVQAILFQLTSLGRFGKFLETNIVEKWIIPILKKDNKLTIAKILALEWYTLLMNFYRDRVTHEARVNYYRKQREMERKQQQEASSSADKKKSKKEEEEEDENFDPEAAMFAEDEKKEEDDAANSSGFDEDTVLPLLLIKQQLVNKEGFKTVIDLVTNQSSAYRETLAWSCVVFMTLQIITDAMNSTPSQDRFEQIVDILLDVGVSNLYADLLDDALTKKSIEEREKIIDDRFRVDYREIIENTLFMMTTMLNHESSIQKLYSQHICDNVTRILLSYCQGEDASSPVAQKQSKENEHDICTGMYISSLCCYLIAKFCCKGKTLASQTVKKFGEGSELGDLITTLISLIKHRKPLVPVRRGLAINAYAALSALLQVPQLATRMIDLEEGEHSKDYSMVKTVAQDIDGWSKADPNAWEFRYSAMVFIKHYTALLQSHKVAGAIFGKILDAKLLQLMSNQLTSRNKAQQEKAAKQRKSGKQQKNDAKQDRENFIHQRYIMPATLAALNSIFQSTKTNADETNLQTLKDMIAGSVDLQQILQFLALMERRKVETGVPLSYIAVLVALFVVFLISLPVIYNFTRGGSQQPPSGPKH